MERDSNIQLSVWKGDNRLDRFLFSCGLFPSVSTAKIRVDKGGVWVNGIRSSMGRQVIQPTDLITVGTSSSNFAIEILYQDEFLLVLNKPIGIETLDFVERAQRVFPHLKLKLVHRLDEETSGALIVPYTPQATRAISQLFKAHKVNKTYLALCKTPKKASARFQKTGTWKSRLSLISKKPFPRWGEVGLGGQWALTSYDVLKKNKSSWLLRLRPKTGRTHQLRVQTCHRGIPILGDRLYGGQISSFSRLMLHAESIEFSHPITGRTLQVAAPLPEGFLDA